MFNIQVYCVIFLIVFSYNLLFLTSDKNRTKKRSENSTINNYSKNSTIFENAEETGKSDINIGAVDLVLLLWIIGLTGEEIRQVSGTNLNSSVK